MKEATIEQFAKDPGSFLDTARRERLVVTRDGEPWVVIDPVGNRDREDLELECSPEFWRMIQERRKEPTVRLEDVEAELRSHRP